MPPDRFSPEEVTAGAEALRSIDVGEKDRRYKSARAVLEASGVVPADKHKRVRDRVVTVANRLQGLARDLESMRDFPRGSRPIEHFVARCARQARELADAVVGLSGEDEDEDPQGVWVLDSGEAPGG